MLAAKCFDCLIDVGDLDNLALLAEMVDDGFVGRLVAGENENFAFGLFQTRAAARLHILGRGESAARKGQPSWPVWAQLQNAARTLVLHSSTCRDLAARLGSEQDD